MYVFEHFKHIHQGLFLYFVSKTKTKQTLRFREPNVGASSISLQWSSQVHQHLPFLTREREEEEEEENMKLPSQKDRCWRLFVHV